MILDYDDINLEISRSLVFSFYGCPELHSEISTTVLDFRETEHAGRVKAVFLNKIEDLPQVKSKELDKGTFSLEWLSKTTHGRPSVITLIYDARTKQSNISWNDFESIICTDIHKIRKSDCYNFMSIFVFILAPNSSFTLDYATEDKDKPFSVKKQIDSKFIKYFVGTEAIKLEAKKLQGNMYKHSIAYYKQVKKNLKLKKGGFYLEESAKLVKINLQLAIVSFIKNRRISTKYLEEVMFHILKLDFNKLSKEHYLEAKAVATFTFRKLCKLKPQTDYLINLFNIYITYFTRPEFYKQSIYAENDLESALKTEDKSFIAEYLWLAYEHEFFASILKSRDQPAVPLSFQYGFPGYYSLKSAYNYNKILQRLKYTNYLAYESKVDLKKLVIKKNAYLGRFPAYFIQIDPLNRKEYTPDADLLLKFFCEKYSVEEQAIFSKMSKCFGDSQSSYDVLSKQTKPDKGTINFSSNIAFNHLVIKYIKEMNLQKERLSGIYRHCLLSKDLHKFEPLKLKLLEDFNEVCDEPNTLLSNLVEIAAIRKLNSKEQDLFHSILANEAVQQKFTIVNNHTKNSILNLCISLTNDNPQVLDISEFVVKVATHLEKLKLRKIKLFFIHPERNIIKEFDKDFILTCGSEFDIVNRIFVKETDRNLYLTNITVDLYCKEGSTVILDYLLPRESSKVLIIKSNYSSKNAIKFEFPPQIKGYVNQHNVIAFSAERINKTVNVKAIDIDFFLNSNDNQDGTASGKTEASFRHPNKRNSTLLNNTNSIKTLYKSSKTPIINKKSLQDISSKTEANDVLSQIFFESGNAADSCPPNKGRKSLSQNFNLEDSESKKFASSITESIFEYDVSKQEENSPSNEQQEESKPADEPAILESCIDTSSTLNSKIEEAQSFMNLESIIPTHPDCIGVNLFESSNTVEQEQPNYDSEDGRSSRKASESDMTDVCHFYWCIGEDEFVRSRRLTYSIKDLLNFEKKEFRFLVQFKKAGTYKVDLQANYRLIKEEAENGTLMISFKDTITFIVLESINLKQDLIPTSYINQDKTKFYPFCKNLKINYSLENKTHFPINVHSLKFLQIPNSMTISTYLDLILNTSPITLLENDESIVSATLACDKKLLNTVDVTTSEVSLSPGKMKINWREPALQDYIDIHKDHVEGLANLFNTTSIPLPKIGFKQYEIELNLILEDSLVFNKPNIIKISMQNNTSEFKRVHYLIDNSQQTIIVQGTTKRKTLLHPFEIKEIEHVVIPLVFGFAALPLFKVIEYGFGLDDKKNMIETKRYSIYYLPKTVKIKMN